MRRLPSSLLLCASSLVVLAAQCATCPAADLATETREKLARKGIVDGKDWSVSLQLVATGRGTVLDFLAEAARARPREVNIIIDRTGIESAGLDLDDPVDLDMKGVSIKEALEAALGKEMAYDVLPNGLVYVTSCERLPVLLKRMGEPAVAAHTPAAARTVARLKTKGMVDGEDWSISLMLTATSLGSVLDFVAEAARMRPREIVIRVDRQAIAKAGVDLDDPVDLIIRDTSIQEALAMMLPDELAFVVEADGTVLITAAGPPPPAPAECEPLRIAQSPQALATCSLVLPNAATGAAPRAMDLDLDGATLETALGVIREKAARLEPPVGITIDRAGVLTAGVALDRPVKVKMIGVSVAQALVAVLPPRLAYSVAADGTVTVSSHAKIIGPLPKAAAETRDKLWRKGVIDGQDWSLSVQMTATSFGTALSWIIEAAKAPPRSICVEVDPQAFANDFGDLHVDLQLKDVSLGAVLGTAIGDEADMAVRNDGSVLVASPKAVRCLIQQGAAFPAREPE